MPTAVRAAAAAIEPIRVSNPAEWGLQYQSLAAEAGQAYARNLRRYNDLLERVARQELPSEQVQRQYRDYFQEQAGATTRQMVELSVALLTGLLHIESRYRDSWLDGFLPQGAPPPPPPEPSGVDITQWFQALNTYATEQSARSMVRLHQLMERIAAGSIAPAAVQEQGRRFAEGQSPLFVGDVVELGMRFVAQLQRASNEITDGLYDRVLGPDVQNDVAAPVCVDLRAAQGAVASASIVVENMRPTAAAIECRVSPFAARAGGEAFKAMLDIKPSHFTLPPGSQRDVDLNLTLDATRFAAGADYAATLRIAGAGERDLIVQLTARAD
jgi:hypothetical protein